MPFALDRDSYSVACWQQAEYVVTKYGTGVSVEQQRALSRQNIGNLAYKAGYIENVRSTSGVAYFILLHAESERRPLIKKAHGRELRQSIPIYYKLRPAVPFHGHSPLQVRPLSPADVRRAATEIQAPIANVTLSF